MAETMDFFLGASSPTGFTDFFTPLLAESGLRPYIIKSGPGCGKSSLMRRVAERALAQGRDCELIHCSSDPDSLDGVVCRSLGFVIADGTAPHVLEPALPGARETVISLYDTLDGASLEGREAELRALTAENAALRSRARRFIAAAGSLESEIYRSSRACLLADKARRYASSLAARELPSAGPFTGSETLRILSAATPLGVYGYGAANAAKCERVYVFEDRASALSAELLWAVRSSALDAGYAVISCRSFLSSAERLDAVIIPSQSMCFISGSAAGRSGGLEGAVRVRDARFYDADALAARERRLSFAKKASASLLAEAGMLLAEAKAAHDKIEAVYTPSVNFDAVREKEARLCASLGL